MSEGYRVVIPSPLRKVIAARMLEATQTIPHFRLSTEIEVDALMEVRKQLQTLEPAAKLSLNDLITKACATALMDRPAVNVQWVDGKIHQYESADVSIVTAVDGGVTTPVIRHADSKTIWEISREVKALSMRAAKNALKLDEIVGGSFSISNLGRYGVDDFDAIINAPQCAILAIGCAKLRCMASKEREVRIATVMRATLSVDHRALDGVAAAEFLSAFKDRLEQPGHLLSAKEDC